MRKVSYNLFALKRQLEIKKARAYTWRELDKLTGVHYNTLNNMANNKTARIDSAIIGRLLDFFNENDLPITIADLFTVTTELLPIKSDATD